MINLFKLSNSFRGYCMEKNKICVSFIGSRGSGKTTVADELAKSLCNLGKGVLRQHKGLSGGFNIRTLWNAIMLWRYFDWEVTRKIGFCGRPPRIIPSLYRLYLPLAFSKDLSDLERNGDVLIYDSNFLRGMMQAFLHREIKVTEIINFYESKILSRLDKMLIVVLDTPPRLAIDRWITRDNINITDEEIEKEIHNRHRLQYAINAVVAEIAKSPKVKVVRLKGNKLPDDNVRQIFSSFDELNSDFS